MPPELFDPLVGQPQTVPAPAPRAWPAPAAAAEPRTRAGATRGRSSPADRSAAPPPAAEQRQPALAPRGLLQLRAAQLAEAQAVVRLDENLPTRLPRGQRGALQPPRRTACSSTADRPIVHPPPVCPLLPGCSALDSASARSWNGRECSPPAPALAIIANVWAPVAVTAAAVGYAAYAASWPTAQRWGPCLTRLPGTGKRIALTFDDGPSNETPRFLEELERLSVPATFFFCGRNIERRPQVAHAAAKAGHAIGNHSYSHPRLLFCPARRVRQELAQTQAAIKAATGLQPHLFRAPYGLRSPALRRVLPELGLSAVHWTVIGRDWVDGVQEIAARILRRASPGGIVCLHDGDTTRSLTDRSEGLKALRIVVPALREQGYRFEALPGA